jgi:LysM repeat protein
MADKSYKELSKQLGKKKTGGNFRTFEEISKDTRIEQIKRLNEPAPIRIKHDKPPKTEKNEMRANLALLAPHAVIACVAALVIALGIFMLVRNNAVEVTKNGDVFAHVKNTSLAAEDIIKTVTARIEQEEGVTIQIDDEIETAPVRGRGRLMMDENALLERLVTNVVYRINAAEILIDGVLIGRVKSEQEANELLEAFKSQYIPEGSEGITSEFVEDVQVVSGFFRKDSIIAGSAVVEELEKSTFTEEIYVVQSGDFISRIMETHNMTLQQMTELNPEYDMSGTLQVGQELTVAKVTPFLSVRTVETKTEVIPVPREEITQTDETLAPGRRRIIREGRDGKKEVTTKTIRINGAVSESTETSEQQIEPSEARIVAVGTVR